jgi:hypothetical protein
MLPFASAHVLGVPPPLEDDVLALEPDTELPAPP